jgi:hypothetical protein
MVSPKGEASELVYQWTGAHETDYLIHDASFARGDQFFDKAGLALDSLAVIASRWDDYFGMAKPVIKHLVEQSGEAGSYEWLWDRFLHTYRGYCLPHHTKLLEEHKRRVIEAIEEERAAGSTRFFNAEDVWTGAVIAVGDTFNPYLDPTYLASELNGILDDDVYFKPFVLSPNEAELVITASFEGRRERLQEKLEALRLENTTRKMYAVKVPAPKSKDRFETTFLDEIEENPVKEWLIDDMLGEGEFSCFWGMPGCGKSVIVGDAAFHVAAGLPWFDKPVAQGLVVYIAAERAELTKRRFAALRKQHGLKGVPLMTVKGRLDFTTGLDDAKEIVQIVRDAEQAAGKSCVWLIVDTVARTFGAGDENAAKDMGAYVQACDLIRQEIGKAHLSLVHHCSRTGEKPRGSIALDGAVDATFKVSKNGELHSVVVDKENDTPDAGPIRFRLKSVGLGHDSKGKATTAPVVEPDNSTLAAFETAEGVRVSIGRNKPRKAALVFSQAIEEAGQLSPDGRTGVHESELRKRLRAASNGPKVKESSLDTMVRRSLKELIDKGDAEKIGEWLFPK